jgi:hypothetical protein
MSLSTSDVISRFDSLEEALKSVFPKVDPIKGGYDYCGLGVQQQQGPR